jgi:hypothetical protein
VNPAVGGLIEYVNVPPILGMIISAGKATLHELQTIYGLEDAYNLAELVAVDSHNYRAMYAQDSH